MTERLAQITYIPVASNAVCLLFPVVVPELEPAPTSIQRLLNSVDQEESPEGQNAFCRLNTLFVCVCA